MNTFKEKLNFKIRLGELLLKEKLITEEQLNQALEIQKKVGKKLGDILVELGFISREKLESTLEKYNIALQQIKEVEDIESIDPNLTRIIPERIASLFKIAPLKKEGNVIYVASTDPLEHSTLEYIRFATGYNVKVVLVAEEAFNHVYNHLYKTRVFQDVLQDIRTEAVKEDLEVIDEGTDVVTIGSLEDMAQQAPVVKFVNYILSDAVSKGASDIHIEPYETRVRVRYRIDGILYEQANIPTKIKEAVVARIKILSKLNVVERRLPQDGRIKLRVGDKEVDIRVSTVPTVFGEKVVMRLLDKSSLVFDLEKLGFEPEQLAIFERAITKPYGMILITGPTGSGKTTTLYSALKKINRESINITTVEDPVEYNFEGLNQVNVNETIGLTFASALRAFLRQDPDVILVGEIRDFETADIAIKASLTGHLVFSTLHTNNAPSTVTRLIDMGVEPFLVSSSLLIVVAQRLVRKICPYCKEEYKPKEELLKALNITDQTTFYRGKGCNNCRNTGYKGRIGIYEIMEVNDEIRKVIVKKEDENVIREIAIKNGMKTLLEAGVTKAKNGITTL
ncbi:MAG: type IV-A pilus assembly ATPase PilB, partial [Thermosulfidibacteraceae bacterium]